MTNVSTLIKDNKSKAVLETDNKSLEAYKRRKIMMQTVESYNKKMDSIDERLEKIHNCMTDIQTKIEKITCCKEENN